MSRPKTYRRRQDYRHVPTVDEAALIFQHLMRARERERQKELQRIRLPDVTIRRLWARERLSDAFLRDIQIRLLGLGWVFFDAGAGYGAVRVEAWENWPAVSTRPIRAALQALLQGEAGITDLANLIEGPAGESDEEQTEAEEDDPEAQ
jgi:hypothetical protein